MSTVNSRVINEGTNTSKDKSFLRMINISSPGDLTELDFKKSSAFACETEGKNCPNGSRIPKPLLTASYSFNETLKGNKSKTKKAPSMIPRSKSRKRNEIDKVKFDIPSKSESMKKEFDASDAKNKKSSDGVLDENYIKILPTNRTLETAFLFNEENSWLKPLRVSPVRSCQDFLEITTDESNMFYKDAQEEPWSGSSDSEATLRNQGHEEIKGPPAPVKIPDDERDAARQDTTIRNLYETLKSTFGSLLDNFKWVGPEHAAGETFCSDSASEFSTAQGQYEFTLKEISNIWKDTISLIGSVRDHTLKFVEENSKLIDKEQLTLEAEMLQLALDFAISYSKLKTDFLINLVKRRFNVKSLQKTELENFMDSKAFAALYNNDDLAAMAQTVQDLNTSLLKGEDVELK